LDFSDPNLTKDDITSVAARLLQYGVTSICPTLVSVSAATYKTVLPKFRELKEDLNRLHAAEVAQPSVPVACAPATPAAARLIGLHLEGPFLAKEKKGAHEEANLRAPRGDDGAPLGGGGSSGIYGDDDDDEEEEGALAQLNRVYGPVDWTSGLVRVVTLAPELRGGLAAVRALSRKGVLVSIGHTQANTDEADKAVEAGAALVTHMFNAMESFKHRDPGVVGLLGRRPRGLPSLQEPSPTLGGSGWRLARSPQLAGSGSGGSAGAPAPASDTAEAGVVVTPYLQLPPLTPGSRAHGPRRGGAPPPAISDGSPIPGHLSLQSPPGSPRPQPGAPDAGAPKTPPPGGARATELAGSGRAAAAAAAAAAAPAPSGAFPCDAVVEPDAPNRDVAACRPFYSLIADGAHVHPYAVSLAFDTHPAGLILVTDAVNAMGLPAGEHTVSGLGAVDIRNGGAYPGLHVVKKGTDILAGAVVPLNTCLNNFRAFTNAKLEDALKTVTVHPAAALGLSGVVGTLQADAFADMVLLRDAGKGSVAVAQTWVGGVLGYQEGREGSKV
jgi:N-acetylglucosamine-6-phosphate deacetylase